MFASRALQRTQFFAQNTTRSMLTASASDNVRLRGTKLASRGKDMPTMLWFSDIMEPAENFTKFFNRPTNKILNYRNVHLVDMRNQGASDHNPSYDLDEMTGDVMRYMDEHKITMATIGGHGFGAKLATATATANLDRFTGVINLEGGPVCHKYHEAWYELKDNIDFARNMKLSGMEPASAMRAIETGISCPKW